jgi:hypothetical protein
VTSFPKDTEDDLIVEMDDGYTFRIQAKGRKGNSTLGFIILSNVYSTSAKTLDTKNFVD